MGGSGSSAASFKTDPFPSDHHRAGEGISISSFSNPYHFLQGPVTSLLSSADSLSLWPWIYVVIRSWRFSSLCKYQRKFRRKFRLWWVFFYIAEIRTQLYVCSIVLSNVQEFADMVMLSCLKVQFVLPPRGASVDTNFTSVINGWTKLARKGCVRQRGFCERRLSSWDIVLDILSILSLQTLSWQYCWNLCHCWSK